jgi:hypothetical protein
MRFGIALKIRQRADVLQGNHNIQFTVLTVLRGKCPKSRQEQVCECHESLWTCCKDAAPRALE